MNKLEIRPAKDLDHKEILDFVIDGRSLKRKIQELEHAGGGNNPRTPPDLEMRDLLLLETQGDTMHGRVGLYVCPLCADYYCGVVSVKIKIQNNIITWSEFGFEQGDEKEDFWLFENFGSYQFDEKQYRQTIQNAAPK